MVVREIDPAGDRVEQLADIMRQATENAIDWAGRDLGGFAIVSWDMRGAPRTAFCTQVGPIAEGMMPSYVRDVLSRHVAKNLADAETEIIDPR